MALVNSNGLDTGEGATSKGLGHGSVHRRLWPGALGHDQASGRTRAPARAVEMSVARTAQYNQGSRKHRRRSSTTPRAGRGDTARWWRGDGACRVGKAGWWQSRAGGMSNGGGACLATSSNANRIAYSGYANTGSLNNAAATAAACSTGRSGGKAVADSKRLPVTSRKARSGQRRGKADGGWWLG
ncbi:hypothetical protein NL676_008314 [Syzygium grande]|nr:hypothetical protein NL676_008314 [Syzygium grande]